MDAKIALETRLESAILEYSKVRSCGYSNARTFWSKNIVPLLQAVKLQRRELVKLKGGDRDHIRHSIEAEWLLLPPSAREYARNNVVRAAFSEQGSLATPNVMAMTLVKQLIDALPEPENDDD